MAVDVEETRRTRALLGVAPLRDRSWSAGEFDFEVSNPRTRVLGESRVLTVEVLVRRNGFPVYEDRINMPNPPLGVRNDDGTVRENPLGALRDSIRDVVRAVTGDGRFPRLERRPDGTFKGDTLAVRSGTNDGRISSANATWTTCLNGSTLVAATSATAEDVRATWTGAVYQIRQVFLDFDTSSLGAGATVTNGVFTLYGNTTAETDAVGYDIQIRSYNWGGTLTTADYVDSNPQSNWTANTLMAHFDVTSWSQGSGNANNFTVDSYAAVSKTGTTSVVVGLSALGSGTPTGDNSVEFRMADQSGTTSDPLLTVTYTPGGTAFTQSLSGTVTPAGIVAKKVTAPKTGTVTPAATIAQKVSKLLGGTVTPAADVTTRVFNGQTLEGSVTPTSSITNKVTKTLAGTVTPVAAIVNAVRKALSGAVAPDGTATNVRAQHQSIDGSVTPTASITNLVRQTLTATVTPAATVVKFVAKAVGGTVTPAGTVAKKVAKTLSGSVTPTATLVFKRAMTLTGTVTPAGAITNIYRKASVIWAVAHDALSIFATARDAEEIRGSAFDTASIDGQAFDQESIATAAHDAASITGEARDG